MKKTHLLHISAILFLTCFLSMPAKASTNGGKIDPFQFFKSLYQAQSTEAADFTVLTPVDTAIVSSIKADFLKALKVKQVVDLSACENVGAVLTEILRTKYIKKNDKKSDFLKIQYSPRSSDFAEYLSNYPESDFIEEAKLKQACLKQNEDWLEAKATNTWDKYGEFAQTYASRILCNYDGYGVIAQQNFRRVEETVAWLALINSVQLPKSKDYEQLVETFGNDLYYISEVNDSLKTCYEREDWETALAANNIDAYKQYLDKHGDGLHAWKARNSIAEIEAWQKAVTTDDYMAYCDYFQGYSEGAHIDEAIAYLKAKEEPLWKEATTKNTIAAYDDFISRYPKGFYANEAGNRAGELRLKPHQKKAKSINDLMRYGMFSETGYSLILLGNIDTDRSFTISLIGPTGFSKKLYHGQYEWVKVKNGTYKVLVEGSRSNLESWWGTTDFYNSVYGECWSTSTKTKSNVDVAAESKYDKALCDRMVEEGEKIFEQTGNSEMLEKWRKNRESLDEK